MHSVPTPASPLAASIGGRVRAGRLARGWTLDRMAERSGVSRRMLVKVEQGGTNPSVGTLLLLGDALGIGLPALVAERDGVPAAVVRAGHGATLWTSPAGGSGVLLAGTPSPDVLELWRWTLRPGDVHASPAHSPGTREVLTVTAGAVTLTTGADTAVLEVGDSSAFDGDQPHSYAASGAATAVFVLAVFEPDVGAEVPRHQDG